MTFWGEERFRKSHGEGHDAHGEHHGSVSRTNRRRSMTLPLIVLAVGSLVVGWVGIPHALTGGANINMFERWLEPVIVKVHEPTPAQPHEVAQCRVDGCGIDKSL